MSHRWRADHRTAFRYRFSLSTLTWVPGIKHGSPGWHSKRLYLLSNTAGLRIATAAIEKSYGGCLIFWRLHLSLTPARCKHRPKKTEMAVLQSLTRSFLQKPFKLIVIFPFTVWYLNRGPENSCQSRIANQIAISSADWTNALASAGVTLWAYQCISVFYLGTFISKLFVLSR